MPRKWQFWDLSFWMRKWPTSLGFSFFFAFPLSSFLIFLLQWLTFYWVDSRSKTCEKASWRRQFLPYKVTTWSGRKFFSEFFTQIFEHFWTPLSWSPWYGKHWKDFFLLQKLSIDDDDFGQRWWCQKWIKGQGSSKAVTGGTGVNGPVI